MPPDRRHPEDPRDWLDRARSNLSLARARPPGVLLEDLCFEAQQSAEKGIKALLLSRGIPFPFIHDLARLLSLLEQAGEKIPDTVRRAAELTPYAVMTRYPGLAEPVTEERYREALAIAETVLAWVEGALP
jgi:HEPN domain-containing protein